MQKKNRDLCCICVNGVHCVDRGTAKRPKFHCEAFDVGIQSSRLREESTPSVNNTIGGVCCNCGNRPHCTIQTPEGSTWYCEEHC